MGLQAKKFDRPRVPFEPIYPDVLGAITGGPRINMDALECAIGVFPKQAFLNQPCEVVLALQNMVDQPTQVKVALRMPTTDRRGNVVVMDTPKGQVSLTLQPGEAGILRLPVVALPPTKPGKDFPVRVALRYRTAQNANTIRPPGGGVQPSMLSVSPFKLQVLREVEYAAHKWNESTDILTVYFDVAPQKLDGAYDTLKPRYEALWTPEVMEQEVRQAVAFVPAVLEYATSAGFGSAYPSLLEAVTQRFAAREMPLYPGEAMAIAKMMAYTVDIAPMREPDVTVEDTRWFRGLCQLVGGDETLLDHDRNEIISHRLFEAVLYEAIMLAFPILQQRVKQHLGDREERVSYTHRVLTWFGGHGEGDLSYIYLPLVLCGLVVSRHVGHQNMENAWDIADALEDAYHGRIRLAAGATSEVFDMLYDLVEDYKRTLRYQRVERPGSGGGRGSL
ncbi:MAG: hypothetical protein SF029_00890 [bacterium]|nr:hypothetical protein [bacterium]